jgi:threonine synthase
MKYLNTGSFNPVPSQMTISNAMDVGNPSNLERIRFMYNDEASAAGQNIRPYSFSDDETRKAIRDGYEKFNYFFDPHGAVAYLAAEKDRFSHNAGNHYVILETAHPAKFGNEMKGLNAEVNMPERLREYLDKKKESVIVEKDYESFKHQLSEILQSRES